jgi:aryl-alcohol dehydrogenase-like predicted oxidoreductase
MSELPTRILGKTGARVSVLGLGAGAIGFGVVSHEEGIGVVRRCLELGVTYFDTAHHYGSEPIVGDGLKGYRDGVFLVTKTVKRNRAAAAGDIAQSLRELKTDRIDLLLMHCVNTIGDLDAVLAPNGSLAAALDAQRAGAVQFIGISGHARPNILALALERYPFDVVFPALGVMDSLVTAPQEFIVPAARRHNAGLVGMKVLGAGRMIEHAELAIRFTLDLGAQCAVVGVKSVAEVDRAIGAVAGGVKPLSDTERATLLAAARKEVVGTGGGEGLPWWLGDSEVIALRSDWVGAAV